MYLSQFFRVSEVFLGGLENIIQNNMYAVRMKYSFIIGILIKFVCLLDRAINVSLSNPQSNNVTFHNL